MMSHVIGPLISSVSKLSFGKAGLADGPALSVSLEERRVMPAGFLFCEYG